MCVWSFCNVWKFCTLVSHTCDLRCLPLRIIHFRKKDYFQKLVFMFHELFHLVLLELFSYWDTKNSEAKPKYDFLWVLQFCKQISSYINKARKNWSLVTNKANIINGFTILSSLWLLLNLPGFQSLESHLVLQISSALPLMTS